MTRPLHIAFITEHASPIAQRGGVDAGGQNVYVDEVSRNLGRLGHSVDIITRRDNVAAPEVVAWAPGVRVVHLDVGPTQFLPKDDLWPLMPEFRTALLRFMLRDGVRYDIVHGNFWMSGWIATELKRTLGLPFVQIFHAMGKTKQRHQGAADTSPADRIAVELKVVREADALIAQCPSEQVELVDDYLADPHNVQVIPSAVNTKLFRPVPQATARRRLGLALDDLVVVYVGRMLPRKDVRNLVQAFALLVQQTHEQERSVGSPITHHSSFASRLKLLLVGGETVEPDPAVTPEIGVLQAMAAELGVADRMIFTGKRQPDTLRDYYSAGDVAVTTPWYEPFGLTPLEGMACGRPVVGSAVGGITFTIDHGVTGYLVPPRDPEALTERLFELLTQPDLRARMGHAARVRVERSFTWATVAERTAALYKRVLETKDEGRKTEDRRPKTEDLDLPSSFSLQPSSFTDRR